MKVLALCACAWVARARPDSAPNPTPAVAEVVPREPGRPAVSFSLERIEGYPAPSGRCRATLDGHVDDVCDVLLDGATHREWVSRLAESVELSPRTPLCSDGEVQQHDDQRLYFCFDLPFPAWDRQVSVTMTSVFEAEGNATVIDIRATVPAGLVVREGDVDEAVPGGLDEGAADEVGPGVDVVSHGSPLATRRLRREAALHDRARAITMDRFRVTYLVRAAADDADGAPRTDVELRLGADPGGSCPQWMANFAMRHAVRSMERLQGPVADRAARRRADAEAAAAYSANKGELFQFPQPRIVLAQVAAYSDAVRDSVRDTVRGLEANVKNTQQYSSSVRRNLEANVRAIEANVKAIEANVKSIEAIVKQQRPRQPLLKRLQALRPKTQPALRPAPSKNVRW